MNCHATLLKSVQPFLYWYLSYLTSTCYNSMPPSQALPYWTRFSTQPHSFAAKSKAFLFHHWDTQEPCTSFHHRTPSILSRTLKLKMITHLACSVFCLGTACSGTLFSTVVLPLDSLFTDKIEVLVGRHQQYILNIFFTRKKLNEEHGGSKSDTCKSKWKWQGACYKEWDVYIVIHIDLTSVPTSITTDTYPWHNQCN